MLTWLTKRNKKIHEEREPLTQNKCEPSVFLHIQKTAGTSLVHIAASQYGNDSIISHGDFLGRDPESLHDIPFVSGHFGYDYAKNLIASRKSFTFLREPGERVLSLYYYFRSKSPDTYPIHQIAHDVCLLDFLKLGLEDPLVRSRIWNNQTWQLAYGYGNDNKNRRFIYSFTSEELIKLALEHIKEFTFVGVVEQFDRDLDSLVRKLGWIPVTDKVKSNVNEMRKKINNLSKKELFYLDQLTALDRIVYKEVLRLRGLV